jgi:hypothetical protein
MLTLVIGTAVLVSYRIGMNSGQRSVIKSVSDEDVKVYLKGDEEVVPDPTFPVRQNDDKSGNLDGWIIVDVPVITGYIMIDSTRYDANKTIDKKVKSGQHEVQWVDRDGVLLYREAVTVLPFQTKRIPLPMQKKAEQSR